MDEKKPDPFNIPSQFADFVSIEENDEIVILQFAQAPLHPGQDMQAIAKIVMPRSLATSLGEALNGRGNAPTDEANERASDGV